MTENIRNTKFFKEDFRKSTNRNNDRYNVQIGGPKTYINGFTSQPKRKITSPFPGPVAYRFFEALILVVVALKGTNGHRAKK